MHFSQGRLAEFARSDPETQRCPSGAASFVEAWMLQLPPTLLC